MNRVADVNRLYALLGVLRDRLGGYRYLHDCSAQDGWPRRGVYFFFENGEEREVGGLRVVRVGTHALGARSRPTLWDRLRQHRETSSGGFADGGSHRSSVFRRHVGDALLIRDRALPDVIRESWGQGSSASRETRQHEHDVQRAVSHHIGRMPLLWLAVPDPPGPGSDRARIEAGAIALLSNRGNGPTDPPSSAWLGRYAARPALRESGLWNVNHVDDDYDRVVLDSLEAYVGAT